MTPAQRYRLNHPEEYREANRRNAAAYRGRNLSKLRKYQRTWWATQARLKTKAHVAKSLRSRMCLALKGTRKFGSFTDLVGCSPEELRAHLEAQFKPGMSWANYGAWHVDHIKPCARFDLSKPEEQRACFHFSNLQPLWAKDNLSRPRKCS